MVESLGRMKCVVALYEHRKAWAAEHGHNLKRMVHHLIERQGENPRLSRDVNPEEAASEPRLSGN
jgi:hypothetical protein